MTTEYFSDREQGPRPRNIEEISENAWGGIVAIVESRIADGSFGYKFSMECQDGGAVFGTNTISFISAVEADIPVLSFPLRKENVPHTLVSLDLIQFCYRCVAKPIKREHHGFYKHYHLDFNQEEGQIEFRDDINRIFSRNCLSYELKYDGRIERLAPPVLSEALSIARFRTGELELDSMLEAARNKYLDPDLEVRKDALEKLWDAWERLKTLEFPEDKKKSLEILLDKVSTEPKFKEVIGNDARALTNIGNDFYIRHKEIGKAPIGSNEQVDYFFHRMFSMIFLILRTKE